MMILKRRDVLLAGAGCAAAIGLRTIGAAWAQDADPAALLIQDFYDVLLDAMRHAGELKMRGRVDKLRPAVAQTFDAAAMTRLAVGPEFAKLGPAEQDALRDAFGTLLVATFASTFDDFKGERFTVDDEVLPQGSDKLVKTRFHAVGTPVEINFLLRTKGGAWKVIDIYLNGSISQLATWRSTYGSLISQVGYTGMMSAVREQTEKFMGSF